MTSSKYRRTNRFKAIKKTPQLPIGFLPQFPGPRPHLLDNHVQPSDFQSNALFSPVPGSGLGIRLGTQSLAAEISRLSPADIHQPEDESFQTRHPTSLSWPCSSPKKPSLNTTPEQRELNLNDILVDCFSPDEFRLQYPSPDDLRCSSNNALLHASPLETFPQRMVLGSPKIIAETSQVYSCLSSYNPATMSTMRGSLMAMLTPEMSALIVDASVRRVNDDSPASSLGIDPTLINDSGPPGSSLLSDPFHASSVCGESCALLADFGEYYAPNCALTFNTTQCAASASHYPPHGLIPFASVPGVVDQRAIVSPILLLGPEEPTSSALIKTAEIEITLSDSPGKHPWTFPLLRQSFESASKVAQSLDCLPEVCMFSSTAIQADDVTGVPFSAQPGNSYYLTPSARKVQPVSGTICMGTPVIDAFRGIDIAELHGRAAKFKERNSGSDIHRNWLSMFAGRLSNMGEPIDQYRCYINGCMHSNKRRDHILVHIGGHIGERPFKCSYCSKRFLRKNERKRHELSHTGSKPFTCFLCPAQTTSFARQDMLSRHLRRYHQLNWTRFPSSLCAEPPHKQRRLS